MKIIIDECVPHIVKQRLPHRQIKTVQEMGWAGVKNGELLKLVEAEFEVFITSDKIFVISRIYKIERPQFYSCQAIKFRLLRIYLVN